MLTKTSTCVGRGEASHFFTEGDNIGHIPRLSREEKKYVTSVTNHSPLLKAPYIGQVVHFLNSDMKFKLPSAWKITR